MKYKVTSQAKTDLIEIWEFTKDKWSVQQADHYYQNIIDKLDNISKHPNIGKSYDQLRNGYRGLPVKSHIIFYKVDHNNTNEIIRILHQSMDIEHRL